MDLELALSNVQKSNDFKIWKSSRANSYFSYAFIILMEPNENWQIGYYDKERDKITTFIVKDNAIEVKAEEEIFKNESMNVLPIEKERVKIKLDKVITNAKDFQKKKYPNEIPIKIIAILQNLENFGTIWNLTFITSSFNTLNMKIKADNGNIVEHKISPIISFGK